MKSIPSLVLFSLGLTAVAFFSGCATGSGLATSDVKYEATDAASVKVLTQYPEHYETVGFVEASAPKGYLRKAEHASRNALKELKRQAALLGASAVVIKAYGAEKVPDFSLDDDDALGLVFNTEHKTIRGEAIR